MKPKILKIAILPLCLFSAYVPSPWSMEEAELDSSTPNGRVVLIKKLAELEEVLSAGMQLTKEGKHLSEYLKTTLIPEYLGFMDTLNPVPVSPQEHLSQALDPFLKAICGIRLLANGRLGPISPESLKEIATAQASNPIAFCSPVKLSNGTTYVQPRATLPTPQGTPTRQKNLRKMSEGELSVRLNMKGDSYEGKFTPHHANQSPEGIVVDIPMSIHKGNGSKGFSRKQLRVVFDQHLKETPSNDELRRYNKNQLTQLVKEAYENILSTTKEVNQWPLKLEEFTAHYQPDLNFALEEGTAYEELSSNYKILFLHQVYSKTLEEYYTTHGGHGLLHFNTNGRVKYWDEEGRLKTRRVKTLITDRTSETSGARIHHQVRACRELRYYLEYQNGGEFPRGQIAYLLTQQQNKGNIVPVSASLEKKHSSGEKRSGHKHPLSPQGKEESPQKKRRIDRKNSLVKLSVRRKLFEEEKL